MNELHFGKDTERWHGFVSCIPGLAWEKVEAGGLLLLLLQSYALDLLGFIVQTGMVLCLTWHLMLLCIPSIRAVDKWLFMQARMICTHCISHQWASWLRRNGLLGYVVVLVPVTMGRAGPALPLSWGDKAMCIVLVSVFDQHSMARGVSGGHADGHEDSRVGPGGTRHVLSVVGTPAAYGLRFSC